MDRQIIGSNDGQIYLMSSSSCIDVSWIVDTDAHFGVSDDLHLFLSLLRRIILQMEGYEDLLAGFVRIVLDPIIRIPLKDGSAHRFGIIHIEQSRSLLDDSFYRIQLSGYPVPMLILEHGQYFDLASRHEFGGGRDDLDRPHCSWDDLDRLLCGEIVGIREYERIGTDPFQPVSIAHFRESEFPYVRGLIREDRDPGGRKHIHLDGIVV